MPNDRGYDSEALTILSRVSGFLSEAGFTHSLNPARNCTFGCVYCYVPTMRVQAGLKPDDWRKWGQFTTFKSNSGDLLKKELRPNQIIYCSPLVDPYQPAEAERVLMPQILEAVLESRPRVFVLQTRGPLICRDIDLLTRIAKVTTLRIGFSVTTNRDSVRQTFESRCASINDRFAAIRALRQAGLEVYATLAPILPCDPEQFVQMAVEATGRDLIADPLHVRSAKPRGATTRQAALVICEHRGFEDWLDPAFQDKLVDRMRAEAVRLGRTLEIGPPGFGRLAGGPDSPQSAKL